MTFVANPFVALLDANVLFPFRIRDALFTFAHEGLFRARFTHEILDEWTRNLIGLKPHLAESIGMQRGLAMRASGCIYWWYIYGYAWMEVPRWIGDRSS